MKLETHEFLDCVTEWGVHQYAHKTSKSSLTHFPLSCPRHFFNSNQNHLLSFFSFTICLRVFDGCNSMLDTKTYHELIELSICKM